jgi:excisionase family DNA binding protein
MSTPTQQPTDSLLTPREAARLARVDLSTIRRWVRDRSLPALKLGDYPNAQVRIPVSALLDRMVVVRQEEKR